MAFFFFPGADNQTYPDLSGLWENTEVSCQWWFPVNLHLFSTREDISSFPGAVHCLLHSDREGIGQDQGTKVVCCCRKPAFYCLQGWELLPSFGDSEGSAAVTLWGGIAGWEVCGSLLRGRMLWRAGRDVECASVFSNQYPMATRSAAYPLPARSFT